MSQALCQTLSTVFEAFSPFATSPLNEQGISALMQAFILCASQETVKSISRQLGEGGMLNLIKTRIEQDRPAIQEKIRRLHEEWQTCKGLKRGGDSEDDMMVRKCLVQIFHDIVRHQLPPQPRHPLPTSSSRRHTLQPVSSYMAELCSSGNDVNTTASRSTNAASDVDASDATVKIEPVTVTNPVGPSVTLKPISTTPSFSSTLSALSTIIDLTEDSGDDQELLNAASMAGRQETDARCHLSLTPKLEHEDEAELPDSTAGNSTTTDIPLPFMDAVSILRTLQPDQEEVVSPTAGGVSGANLKRKDGPSVGSEKDPSNQDATQVKPKTEGVKRKKIEQSPRILVASRNKQTVTQILLHLPEVLNTYKNDPIRPTYP